jgi:hypothetical protein
MAIMGIKLRRSVALVVTTVAVGLVGSLSNSAAMAQDANRAPASRTRTIDEQFDRTFFRHEPDSFRLNDLSDQFSSLFITFPENRINSDGKGLDRLYREVLRQETTHTLIRTADLPTPFDGSLLTRPLVSESPVPPAPASPYLQEQSAPPPEPEQPAAPAQPEQPQSVPALW